MDDGNTASRVVYFSTLHEDPMRDVADTLCLSGHRTLLFDSHASAGGVYRGDTVPMIVVKNGDVVLKSSRRSSRVQFEAVHLRFEHCERVTLYDICFSVGSRVEFISCRNIRLEKCVFANGGKLYCRDSADVLVWRCLFVSKWEAALEIAGTSPIEVADSIFHNPEPGICPPFLITPTFYFHRKTRMSFDHNLMSGNFSVGCSLVPPSRLYVLVTNGPHTTQIGDRDQHLELLRQLKRIPLVSTRKSRTKLWRELSQRYGLLE